MTAPQRLHCPLLFDGDVLRRDGALAWQGGRFVDSVGPGAPLRLPEGHLAAPGLIDIQVNGGGQVLFNDEPTAQGVRRIADAHARSGTTGLLPTLITDTPAQRSAAIAAVRTCLAAGDPGVLGIHLEGPFLQVTRRGIHRADLVATLRDDDVAGLTALGSAGRTLVTLAPECVGVAQVRALSDAGVLVFAGHTEARYAQLRAAVDHGGLCGLTHLFNAMSQLGPRDAGVAGGGLLHPELWAGLILDGHHLGPESVALAWRLRGRERSLLVSDAMAPAGGVPEPFVLQGQEIEVRDGRCVDAQGTLAGAAITLSDAVRIGVQRYGLPLSDLLYSASHGPARLLGLAHERGTTRTGSFADLVVLDAQLQVAGVLQRGRWLWCSDAMQQSLGAPHVG